MRALALLFVTFFSFSVLATNTTMWNDFGWASQAATPVWAQYECPGGKTIQADDVQTQLDVRDFILCAKSYVEKYGIATARRAFTTQPQWRSRNSDVYVFVDNNTGRGDEATSYIFPPDPKREGKVWGELWDFFSNEYFQEVYRVVQNFGHGWSYYAYRNPDTRRPEPKFSYVARARVGRFGEHDVVVGGGVYPRGTSNDTVYGTCDPVEVNAVDLGARYKHSLRYLRNFVRCAAQVYTESSMGVVEEFAVNARWRSSSIYLFAVNPQLNKTVFSARDYENLLYFNEHLNKHAPEWEAEEAGLAGRNVDAIALGADESFLYYKNINPATNRLQRKVVFLKRAVDKFADAEVLIASGYYLEDDEQAHASLDCTQTPMRSFTNAALVETREDLEAFVRSAACFVTDDDNNMATIREAFHEVGKWNDGEDMYLWVEEFDRTASYTDENLHNAGVLEVYGHPTSGTAREGRPWGEALIDKYENSYYPEIYRILNQQETAWTYYSYPNPSQRTSEFKSVFSVLVDKDGKSYVVGAGLWDRSVPGACEPGDINADIVEATLNPRMLQDLVRCAEFQIRPTGVTSVRPGAGGTNAFSLLPQRGTHTRWHSQSGSVYMSIFTSTGYPFGISGRRFYEWHERQQGPNPETRIFPILNSMGEMFLHYYMWDPGTRPTPYRKRRKLMYIKRLPITNNYVGAGYYVD